MRFHPSMQHRALRSTSPIDGSCWNATPCILTRHTASLILFVQSFALICIAFSVKSFLSTVPDITSAWMRVN
jgi:hypothetical protein